MWMGASMARKGVARKRSYSEIFLAKLSEISKGEQALVGNITFRSALNWDEDRYNRVKSQLVDENKIIVGRGKGGSVALANVPGTKALSVFVCYSHADESQGGAASAS